MPEPHNGPHDRLKEGKKSNRASNYIMLKLWNALSFCLFLRASIGSSENFDEQNVNYIVGGEVISVVNAPYQAVIFHNNEFHCGGNIVAPIWILTAGHCVVTRDELVFPANDLFVRVGTDDPFEAGEMDQTVDTVFLHPYFSLRALNFDVSLLRLSGPLVYSERVRCIPMAPPGTLATPGEMIFVTGYGQTSARDTSPPADTHLRSIQVPVVDHDACNNVYAPELAITDRMFCAAVTQDGTCHYDSGGPAVFQGQLLGLVSGGRTCGDQSTPGLYALIPSMSDWIGDTIELNSQHNPPDGQCY
uniref:trypsin n=1 Tax=Anopheles atroparvus TaxID=41427 RepID=A0A182J3Z5_ANOAO